MKASLCKSIEAVILQRRVALNTFVFGRSVCYNKGMLHIICYFAFFAKASTGLYCESVDKAREHLAQSVKSGYELDLVMQLGGQLHKTDLAGLNLRQKQQRTQEVKDSFYKELKGEGMTLSADSYGVAQKIEALDLLDVGVIKGLSGWEETLEKAVRLLDDEYASQKSIEQANTKLMEAHHTLVKWVSQSTFHFFVPQNLNEDEQRAYARLCKDLRDLLEYNDYREEVVRLRLSFNVPGVVLIANHLVQKSGSIFRMLDKFHKEKVLPLRELLNSAYCSWVQREDGVAALVKEYAGCDRRNELCEEGAYAAGKA